jgi:hypothetical protein
MHDTKLDLTTLDPSRDDKRWALLIESIVGRAVARHKKRLTIGYQLLSWSRPVLATAAAITLVFGAKAVFHRSPSEVAVSSHYQQAYTLSKWAYSQERPATSNVIFALGDPNVTE